MNALSAKTSASQRLHSIDYMPFEGDHVRLPGRDEFTIEPIGRD